MVEKRRRLGRSGEWTGSAHEDCPIPRGARCRSREGRDSDLSGGGVVVGRQHETGAGWVTGRARVASAESGFDLTLASESDSVLARSRSARPSASGRSRPRGEPETPSTGAPGGCWRWRPRRRRIHPRHPSRWTDFRGTWRKCSSALKVLNSLGNSADSSWSMCKCRGRCKSMISHRNSADMV